MGSSKARVQRKRMAKCAVKPELTNNRQRQCRAYAHTPAPAIAPDRVRSLPGLPASLRHAEGSASHRRQNQGGCGADARSCHTKSGNSCRLWNPANPVSSVPRREASTSSHPLASEPLCAQSLSIERLTLRRTCGGGERKRERDGVRGMDRGMKTREHRTR